MKKLLLLVAAATIALGATAATPKFARQTKEAPASVKTLEVRNQLKGQKLTATGMIANQATATSEARRIKAANAPEGVVKPYLMNAYVYTWFGMMYAEDMKANISFTEDGSKVYFGNMFTGVFLPDEYWIPGNVSTDGNSVTIPKDYAITELEWEEEMFTVYAGEFVLDDDGYIVDVKDIVFAKDGDRIYLEDDVDAPTRYIGIWDYEADGSIGLWDYTLCVEYNPFEGSADAVVLPEGAEPADFIYYAYSDYYRVIEEGKVYVDGNDVYMNTLTPGMKAWVKGTKDGNKVSFPSGQYVEGGSYYLYTASLVTDGTTDEYGYLIPVLAESYVLDYDPETGIYSNLDPNQYFALVDVDGALYDYQNQYEVKPFLGFAPAIPSDPYDLYIEDWMDYFGQYELNYSLDPVDVNGDYINTEGLAYIIYMDEEAYTLTPEVFVELTEDMDIIPYGFSDGWDIGNGYIYIGEDLFTTLGIQAVYTCEGVTNYSNVVSVDLEGNQYTMPAPQLNPDGLNNVNVKKVSSVEFYDAQGRKLDAAQKGVNVVKMVAADGSVKTVKMLKK